MTSRMAVRHAVTGLFVLSLTFWVGISYFAEKNANAPALLTFKYVDSGANGTNAYVRKVPIGPQCFWLILWPEEDVQGVLEGWTCILADPSDLNTNLLEPDHPWHGIMPFHIMARDFREGITHSAFWRRRNMPVRGKGGTLTIDVQSASVVKTKTGQFAFKELKLLFEVGGGGAPSTRPLAESMR